RLLQGLWINLRSQQPQHPSPFLSDRFSRVEECAPTDGRVKKGVAATSHTPGDHRFSYPCRCPELTFLAQSFACGAGRREFLLCESGNHRLCLLAASSRTANACSLKARLPPSNFT